jgi:acetyl-CoA C-acetyltransferase
MAGTVAPRTPLLVGAAAVMQRLEDPTAAQEAGDLLIAACEAAADDAGSRDLLRAARSIAVPQGIWGYPDPGRLVAAAVDRLQALTPGDAA